MRFLGNFGFARNEASRSGGVERPGNMFPLTSKDIGSL
jgi:hypothetical protein